MQSYVIKRLIHVLVHVQTTEYDIFGKNDQVNGIHVHGIYYITSTQSSNVFYLQLQWRGLGTLSTTLVL